MSKQRTPLSERLSASRPRERTPGIGVERVQKFRNRCRAAAEVLQIVDQEQIRRAQFLLEAERFAAAERAQELPHEVFCAKDERALAATAGLERNRIEKVRLAETEMAMNVE